MKRHFSNIQSNELQIQSNVIQLSEKEVQMSTSDLNKLLQIKRKNILNFIEQLSPDQKSAVNFGRDYEEMEYSENYDIVDCVKVLQFVDNTIRKMKNNKKMKKNWNKQDLTILLFVIQKYNLKFQKKTESYEDQDWINIAQYVPGKNNLQCMFKWLGLKKNNLNQYPWTEQQQRQLLRLVSKKGTNKWLEVSQKLYLQNKGLKIYRSSKQCREHWTCYMDPKLKKGPWSQQQDLELLKNFVKLGKKWSEISKMLNGRTQNAVKNRFNLIMDKQIRLYGKSFDSSIQHVNQMIMNIQVSLPLNPKRKYSIPYEDSLNEKFNPFIDPRLKTEEKIETIHIQERSQIPQIKRKQENYHSSNVKQQQNNVISNINPSNFDVNEDTKNLKIIKFKKMSLQQLLKIDGVVPATFNKQTMEVVCKDLQPSKIKDVSQAQCIGNSQRQQIRSSVSDQKRKNSEEIFLWQK